jgi:phosphotriesterase-related protein
MKRIIRISFIFILSELLLCTCAEENRVMTVKGSLRSDEMGITLTHEHILVDFIGADKITENRWNRSKVISRVLPYLLEIKRYGCKTFIDCTPEYIGRDPLLLKLLSDSSGLNIITNTGLYGAGNNKYLPQYVCSEDAGQLSERWLKEWRDGIEGTGIRPGFIKIGVSGDSLSETHRKLVAAAALTHLRSGLVIASHTGPARLAFEELDILRKAGVSPQAFIWVHAQNESDKGNHVRAARMGAWVSFDGLNSDNINDYVSHLKNMKDNEVLDHVLISHDAGWYDPAKENGGDFRGYSTLFEKLLPALRKSGFTDEELNQLLVTNPSVAFTIKVRKRSE